MKPHPLEYAFWLVALPLILGIGLILITWTIVEKLWESIYLMILRLSVRKL